MAPDKVDTNIGGALSEKLRNNLHPVEDDGTVSIYGRRIFVGPEAAKYVDGLVTQAQSAISQYGGAYARKAGMYVATALTASDQNAAKVGKVTEALWRFGLPIADIGLGVKTAVRDGYRHMNDLKNESSAVLIANSGDKAGVGQVLTTKFSALSHERALIFEEGRKAVISSLTGVIKNLPTIIINVWQQKKERMQAELTAANPGMLEAPLTVQEPNTLSQKQDPVRDRLSRLFKPKTIKDLDDNLKHSALAPFIGGLASQLVGGDLEKEAGKKTAWRRIKELENVIKEQEPTSGAEIEHLVRKIFQQHVDDHKVKQQLAGNKYGHVMEEVSEALVHGNLHPQALVELLDDKKVIAFDDKGVTYGKPAVVKEHLERLVEKYTAKVTQKEFFKDFTKQEVLEAFKGLSEEEKPFYTMLFKPGILELAGADRAEVALYREKGNASLTDGVVNAMENLLNAGPKELLKEGVKSQDIDDLQAMSREFRNAVHQGAAADYVEHNSQETTDMLRNMVLSAKDQEAFWQRYIQKRAAEEEVTPRIPEQMRTPLNYSNRGENGQEIGLDR